MLGSCEPISRTTALLSAENACCCGRPVSSSSGFEPTNERCPIVPASNSDSVPPRPACGVAKADVKRYIRVRISNCTTALPRYRDGKFMISKTQRLETEGGQLPAS